MVLLAWFADKKDFTRKINTDFTEKLYCSCVWSITKCTVAIWKFRCI